MYLIGYKAYQRGYVGCLEETHRYVYFLFARQRFRKITTYLKEDYQDYRHFVASLQKFVPLHFFLRRPIPVASLENSALAAIGQNLERSLPRDAFLSLNNLPPDPMSATAPAG
jgi:hypothetical protein